MKIAIAQINTSVGDLQANYETMLGAATMAAMDRSDLIVFPELTITGYPPQDLLFKPHFISAQMDMARKTAREIHTKSGIAALFGFVDQDNKGRLYNAVGYAVGGNIVQVFHKTLLPNYDVFDEKRYFQPGKNPQILRLNDYRIGVVICEDMWEDDYDISVMEALKEQGADLFINLSSSPWNAGKVEKRISVAQKRVNDYGIPILYVNQVGGQDELIFDGSSMYYSGLHGSGRPDYLAQFCGEELTVLSFQRQVRRISLINQPEILFRHERRSVHRSSLEPGDEKKFQALTLGLQDYASKTGMKSCVLGLSGGIDSTLTAAIAKEAGLDVLGISLPSHITDDASRNEARDYAKRLGIQFTEIPIREVFDVVVKTYGNIFQQEVRGIARENIQPRIRALYLMLVSNMTGRLLLTTGNKTEMALGFCTLYGDMSGGIGVIGDLEKPEVYRLCQYFNELEEREVISEFVLNRIPTAELEENQVDPFDYKFIPIIVDGIVERHESPESLISRYPNRQEEILDSFKRVRIAQFKRKQSPPILRVSPKAFGMGRRMPIANGFDY